MTSSRVPTSGALLLGLLLAAPMAFADQKSDLYAKGQKAVADGDAVAARDAFCALPTDYSNGDAGTQCTTYKPLADKALFRYKTNFMDGMNAIAAQDWALAETKFKNVKGGDYYDKAQQKLVDLPGLKQKALDAANSANASENANKQKLDQGTNAFNSGNLELAKSTLGGVTGPHQVEAAAVLNKIHAYEAAIIKGKAFESGKDYPAAKSAYAEAVGINPVGPATDLLAKAAAAANAPAPTVATNNPPPTVKPIVPAKPPIDEAAYLNQGHKALAKNDFKKARRFFQEVLGQDKSNQEAMDALASMKTKDTTQASASDDDPLLKGIIAKFYEGNYPEVEDRLKTYIYTPQGTKLGLANFYVGASMLTRYYLSGATDESLKREAKSKFKDAKAVKGFTPPDKFISPKIMKDFADAS